MTPLRMTIGGKVCLKGGRGGHAVYIDDPSAYALDDGTDVVHPKSVCDAIFMSAFPNDELLDLVDEQDQVTGQMLRSEINRVCLRNFRATLGFIVNDQGQLWIPRRAAHKRLFPNGFDFSVDGHVGAGESYEEAFFRESMEELNMDPRKFVYRELGKITPADGAYCFRMAYVIRSNETPMYNQKDFSNAAWYEPKEIVQILEQGEVAKLDLAMAIKRFYL